MTLIFIWNKLMSSVVFCVFLFVDVLAFVDDHADFQNYSVISTYALTQSQLASLRNLYLHDATFHLDFWKEPTAVGDEVVFGIPDSYVKKVTKLLSLFHVPFTTLAHDLTKVFDNERRENPPQFKHADDRAGYFVIDQYHRIEEIQNYLRSLAREHPDFVQLQVLGLTYENREIQAVRIGKSSLTEKRAILIDAGIHAREWLAPATALYIINLLVSEYGNSAEVTQLVNTYDWFVIPVVNPDGYAFTWTTNRVWRKNRSLSSPYFWCYGVDLNRNFPVGYGGASTSTDPCSDLYLGPNAFSEAESLAIKELTEKNAERVHAAITLHSYGQMWMNPWGHQSERPHDYDVMISAAQKAAAAIRSVHGSNYTIGSVYEVIYAAGGGSSDWQYTATKSPLMYTIELRPTESFQLIGFLLPRSQIVPTAQEAWAGIKSLVQNVKENEFF